MKKIIIFVLVFVALFAALTYVVTEQNKQQSADNPYNKETLKQGTIEQLDNPDYDNQILPDELEEQVSSGEDLTVYFYSPDCVYCKEATPVLIPITEEYGIDMKKLNLLEFNDQGAKYSIESTPTIVHFEDGEEVARIVGNQPKPEFEQFFEQEVLEE
ncbi:thioredoxin family protein [Saliterribacillus persicus]|uniref:Thioredoxin n=1 Tax=Saliterribacillus persicus TaxID=930114 RepID=A0A368XNT2_9BACI|nr:thioredoxin family protein [Saliterribacillus persicus]RCW69672.1 thioredoxin [Saliterribacillus persicus]